MEMTRSTTHAEAADSTSVVSLGDHELPLDPAPESREI